MVALIQPLLDTDKPVSEDLVVVLNTLAAALERQLSQVESEMKEIQSVATTVSESESSSVSQFDIDSATSMTFKATAPS